MVLPAFAVEAKVVHVLATGLPESIAMLSQVYLNHNNAVTGLSESIAMLSKSM